MISITFIRSFYDKETIAPPTNTNMTPPNFGHVKLELNNNGAMSVINTNWVAFNVFA